MYASDSWFSKALEAMTRFAVEQGMVPRKYSVEELFAVPN